MNGSQIQGLALPGAGAIMTVALIVGLRALIAFRQSRSDPYWHFRRRAGKHGSRLLSLSILLCVAAGLICGGGMVATLFSPASPTPIASMVAIAPTEVPRSPMPTLSPAPKLIMPTATPSQFPPSITPTAITPSATATDPPSTTPTLLSTPPPTLTRRPAETPTPSDSPTSDTQNSAASIESVPLTTNVTSTPSTPQSSVTPPADATLRIIALDREITPNFAPSNPATDFKVGFTRIYFFVAFSGMLNGMLWRGALLWDGQLVNRYTRVWSSTSEGTGYFFFTQKDGFAAGSYEIRLYLGGSTTPIARAAFTVTG